MTKTQSVELTRSLSWRTPGKYDTQQENDNGFLMSGMLSETPGPVIFRTNGVDAEKSSELSITINDICELYRSSSKPPPMLPMERWAATAVKDECFPLLAKRLMQDAGLGVEKPTSSGRAEASNDDGLAPQAVVVEKSVAQAVALKDDAHGERTGVPHAIVVEKTVAQEVALQYEPYVERLGVLQEERTLSNGDHTISRARSSKRSGRMAKSFKGRRQKRWAIHNSFPPAMPD